MPIFNRNIDENKNKGLYKVSRFYFDNFLVKVDLSKFSMLQDTHSKRSSRPEMFYKKDVLRNFAKFTKRHLCQSHFFNKFAGPRPATSLKKYSGAGIFPWILRNFNNTFFIGHPLATASGCFPVNFAKLLRTPFTTGHLRWLVLV